MSIKAISKALTKLEQVWEDIGNIRIEISPEEFERRIKRKDKRNGTSHSDQWFAHVKKYLQQADVEGDNLARNLILWECHPAELRKQRGQVERLLLRLIGLAEWAYDDTKKFVDDENKDVRLRLLIRYRVLLAADAFRQMDMQRSIGMLESRPRVTLDSAA